MLVPSMIWEEIIAEVNSDYIALLKVMNYKIKNIGFRMSRLGEVRFTETFHLKTDRMNDWTVIVNISPFNSEFCFYLKSHDRHGIVAYRIVEEGDGFFLVKFNSHFFKRYRERMNLETLKPEQVMKHFFKNNMEEKHATSDTHTNGAQLAFFSYPNGMGVGRFDPEKNVVHMKTFITKELFNEQQKRMFEFMESENRTEDVLEVAVATQNLTNKF
ncbi:MAG: hypothetical protein ABI763_12470 [Bacteroidota bacterium]